MEARLLDACTQFEAVMLQPLLDGLKLGRTPHLDAQQDDGDPSAAGPDDLMQSLFTNALALALARDGGLGLGRELVRAVGGRTT